MSIPTIQEREQLRRERDYAYLVYRRNGFVWAKNGRTDEVEFYGPDASVVIQNALNALTPNRTWKEKVLIKGDFSALPTDISIPSYTIVEVQGRIDHKRLKPVLNASKVDLTGIVEEWREFDVPTNAGWTTSNVGSGGAAYSSLYLYVYTGATALSRGMVYTLVFGLNRGILSRYYVDWTKRLELEFAVVRLNSDPECVARVQLKESNVEGPLAQLGVGVEIDNYTVLGESYGTSRGTVALGTIPDDRPWFVKIVKTTDEVRFWINGVLVGRLTGAYVPNVAGNVNTHLVASIINGATGGVDARLYIGGIKIRQEV